MTDTTTADEHGWRPIKTAPKDGQEIWVFNGEQGVMNWTEGVSIAGKWALWIWSDSALSDLDPEPEQPTHWRPLPPPPAARAKEGKA